MAGTSRISREVHAPFFERPEVKFPRPTRQPCAGKMHARFDEGGQAKTCPLLYPPF